MELFFRRYGNEGDQPLIILHGLFGLSDNWVSFARRIAMEGFEVFIVDQRNHGHSPHSPEFNYPVLTDDLFGFISDHEIDQPILLGHSMGGKVAMGYALQYPDSVKKLIVVDIGIKSYPPRTEHLRIIDAMRSVDLSSATHRNELEQQLKPLIPSTRIRQFVMKNLHRNPDGRFNWLIDVEGIAMNIDFLMDGIEVDDKYEGPTLFIKGGASDYILREDFKAIRKNFPNAEIITIDGASHWVHVEVPERFYQLVFGFITGTASKFEMKKTNFTPKKPLNDRSSDSIH